MNPVQFALNPSQPLQFITDEIIRDIKITLLKRTIKCLHRTIRTPCRIQFYLATRKRRKQATRKRFLFVYTKTGEKLYAEEKQNYTKKEKQKYEINACE